MYQYCGELDVSCFTLSKRHHVRKRHKHQLLSHYTASFDCKRRKAGSAFSHTLFFELLRKEVNQYASSRGPATEPRMRSLYSPYFE
jgi:hypothetical protein